METAELLEKLQRATLKKIAAGESVDIPNRATLGDLREALEYIPLRLLLPYLEKKELQRLAGDLDLAPAKKLEALREQISTEVAGGEGYKHFPIKQLHLDPKNPRLLEFGLPEDADQFDLLEVLWKKLAVKELALSIAHCGYYEHEPLLIERTGPDSFIVIEGNRRLAAVRLLLFKSHRDRLGIREFPDIDAIDKDRRTELQTLPAVVTTRKEAWRYLGFKHVNGPSTWGAYAKAQYTAEVHHKYGVPLKEIARQIGDSNYLVERQYRGLMVVQQAEELGVFDRGNVSKGRFYFNFIYTALDLPGFQSFLGINPKRRDTRHPVPRSKIKNLGHALEWLYGNKKRNKAPVIQTQAKDLKTLDLVLLDNKGVKALKDGLPLNVAHEISLGDEQLFINALHDAKRALQRAHGTLSTGYDGSDSSLLRTAEDVDHLAADLCDEMRRKQRSQRGRRKDR